MLGVLTDREGRVGREDLCYGAGIGRKKISLVVTRAKGGGVVGGEIGEGD